MVIVCGKIDGSCLVEQNIGTECMTPTRNESHKVPANLLGIYKMMVGRIGQYWYGSLIKCLLTEVYFF